MKFLSLVLGCWMALSSTGCVSKSKAQADARAAFMAGQQQGMDRHTSLILDERGLESNGHGIPFRGTLKRADYSQTSGEDKAKIGDSGNCLRLAENLAFSGKRCLSIWLALESQSALPKLSTFASREMFPFETQGREPESELEVARLTST